MEQFLGSFFSPLFVSYFPSRVRGHGSIKRAGVFISFPVSFLCVIGKGEGFQVSDRFLVFFLSLYDRYSLSLFYFLLFLFPRALSSSLLRKI